MPKIYTKAELGNLNSTQKDGTINADKTFVVINDNTYLLADLLVVKKTKTKEIKEDKLGAKKVVKENKVSTKK